jgi:16S rRNA (adenine1518-N6/adenine1519-N6)-dimethyltransferase
MLTTSEIVKKYRLITKKSLGQNFLLDSNITDKVAKCAGNLDGIEVLEIGCGPGGLTQSILNFGAKKVVIIEMDKRCIDIIAKEFKPNFGDRIEIIEGDAIKIDERKYLNKPCKIIANLPYNVATKLLFQWLEHADYFESMTLMFQREVADRICAKPKTKEYGRVSVMAQFLCEVKKNFDIKPTAFIPPPKVMSSVVTLVPRKKALLDGVDIERLSKVCEVLFGQRRKIIKSKLKSLEISEAQASEIGISPNARAEELSILDFARLAKI